MKKLIIAASVALLSACSAPQQQQIDFSPTPVINHQGQLTDKSFTLTSKDLRTSQYVALVDLGRSKIDPIHARENVRITIENALAKQFESEGYKLTVNSENTVSVEILKLVLNVKNSLTYNEMNAQISISVTAKNAYGKLVKTYNGSAKKQGVLSASQDDMAMVLNDVTNLIFQKIAEDKELRNYIEENF